MTRWRARSRTGRHLDFLQTSYDAAADLALGIAPRWNARSASRAACGRCEGIGRPARGNGPGPREKPLRVPVSRLGWRSCGSAARLKHRGSIA